MNRFPYKDRVRIWNSFFYLSWNNAKTIYEQLNKCKVYKDFSPLGGMLKGEERMVLGTLAFCTLAIEARANHHIEELVEKGKLTEKEGDAALHLSPDQKWFLLPKLAGRRRSLRSDASPHQSIKEICACRNALVHVNYGNLSKHLPDSGKMLSLFKEFVKAMEDMNVVLGRVKRQRKRVLQIASFKALTPNKSSGR